MMRICLIGGGGQLGRHIQHAAADFGMELLSFDRQALDVTDRSQVQKQLARSLPYDLVINASAYTKVDLAEERVREAFAVNADGPEYLAEFCAAHDLPLIHVSTDYVFDGTGQRPYQPSDPVCPVGVYGKSKAQGEMRVQNRHGKSLIVRCSWLYSESGNNFVSTMVALGRKKTKLQVVIDQEGCPTYAGDLAAAVLDMARVALLPDFRQWGIYHFCNAGSTTWYSLACKIFELARPFCRLRVKNVEPISSQQYPSRVERPPYSVLDCTSTAKVFGIKARPWQDALQYAVRCICKHQD